MAHPCDRYEKCQEDKVASAKTEGQVLTELKNLRDEVKTGFQSMWSEMNINRTDIKALYFRVGIIAGGTSFIVSMVVSFVTKG